MTDGASPILRGESIALTTVGRVVVARWSAASSADDVEAMRRTSEALGREHPRGIAHMNVIDVPSGQLQQPSEPAREAMVRMLRDRAASLRVSSVIFPHAGFQAAVVRSILGGLLILSRTPAVVRVHSSVEQGAEWIVSMLGPDPKDPPPGAAALVSAVDALRG